MRKMSLLAVVALSSAFVAAEPIVYDVTMKVKTTVGKSGNVSVSCIAGGSTNLVYRKQGTISVKGLIWGCGCDSLIGPLTYTDPSADGCYFWNETERKPIAGGTIVWPVLGRIDNKMKKAEGVMELTAEEWYLVCAGFGKADILEDQSGFLAKLKGYFAGWRVAPMWSYISRGEPCSFCESGTADLTYYQPAVAWALCSCAEPSEKTAAFGSWLLKYNKNVSKRLGGEGVTEITQVYTFPSYVPVKKSAE